MVHNRILVHHCSRRSECREMCASAPKLGAVQLQHLLLIKVMSENPHKLDFTHTYCFNCSQELLYRVSYVPIRDPATIEDPVLRFQCVFALV
jgi:hypothetical protein